MADVNIVQVLTVLLLSVLGFLTNRLYKAVDNLVITTQKMKLDAVTDKKSLEVAIARRPDYAATKVISEGVCHTKILEHEATGR